MPGNSITGLVVQYEPGGKSDAHHHAGSVMAYILTGVIRSQNSATGAVRVYKAGESFFEPRGQHPPGERECQRHRAGQPARHLHRRRRRDPDDARQVSEARREVGELDRPLGSAIRCGRRSLDQMQQSGGCVCGANRFMATGAPLRITICHCTWCQRRTGTAFGTEVVFDRSQVESRERPGPTATSPMNPAAGWTWRSAALRQQSGLDGGGARGAQPARRRLRRSSWIRPTATRCGRSTCARAATGRTCPRWSRPMRAISANSRVG